MPRNSWSSLLEERQGAATSSPSPALLPESLLALQRERDALERKMHRLTRGGVGPDDHGDPRFPITSLAERRRADDAWSSARDGLLRTGQESTGEPPAARLTQALRAEPDQDTPALRTAQRALREPDLRSDRLRQRLVLPSEGAFHAVRRLPNALSDAYDVQRERRLSVVEGGCGDLDQRADQARELALARRRLEREQQQADDRRLARARQQRRSQEEG